MDISLWQIILQVFLWLCIALISIIDVAIVTLPDSMLEEKIKEGNFQYFLIKRLLQNPNYYKYAVRLASLILVCFSALLFYHSGAMHSVKELLAKNLSLHGFGYHLLLSLLLLLYIVLIETFFVNIARQIGIKTFQKTAERLSLFLYALYYLLYPFVLIMDKLTFVFSRLLKLDQASSKSVTEEEIRLMMDIGAKKGTIQSEEKQMIENIFEFNNINAEDIMTHRTDVYAININDTNDTIIETIQSSGFSRFPVYDDEIDNIVGILSARRFFLNLHSYPQKSLKEIMYAPYIVPESIRADVLFRKMQLNKNHLAVLVDEYGGFNGIVTMEDLIEEIVGNIYDENDFSDDSAIIRIHKNLWKINGSTEIEAINEALKIHLPVNEDYDTLNGMVFNALSLIPEDGSKFDLELHDLNIQVKKIEDHRIISALVSKKQQA